MSQLQHFVESGRGRAGWFRLRAVLLTIAGCAPSSLFGLPQNAPPPLPATATATPGSDPQAMQFADQPDFKVAGVTDWTAVGGHGSDSILRTSEDLARETLSLKPQDSLTAVSSEQESKLRAALAGAPGSFTANHMLGEYYLRSHRGQEAIPLLQAALQLEPANHENEFDLALAYESVGNFAQARGHAERLVTSAKSADAHRLVGELDERTGDPLAAVREYEQAVRLDPSEQNYFEWGSELLLHRAVWQAAEVLHQGVKAHPHSPRLLSALGTAQFAGDQYEEAAASVCEAADLAPADPQPYSYLGRIEMASPHPLACVLPRLQRFAQQQPDSDHANYLYAMAMLKRQQPPLDRQVPQPAEALLQKAVALDPRCGEAWLQLGILAALRNDLQPAIVDYQRAIEVNAQSGEAYYRMGVAYDRSGKADQAKQAFAKHDEIEKMQAANVERQRLGVKQFLVVMDGQQPNRDLAH